MLCNKWNLSTVVTLGTQKRLLSRSGLYAQVEVYTVDPLGLSNLALYEVNCQYSDHYTQVSCNCFSGLM